MYRLSVMFFTLMAAGLAQMPGPAFSPALREYLALSGQQVASIVGANADNIRFQMAKQLRTAQVQREIAEETARDTVDPMALGLRYMELESIRRELRDSSARTQQAIVAVLNDAQKQKLKTLEEAARLQPLVTDAQCANLLRTPMTGNLIPASRYTGLPAGAVLTVSPVLSAFPTAVCGPAIRTGDFSPSPGQ
jgi:hypothetical protein